MCGTQLLLDALDACSESTESTTVTDGVYHGTPPAQVCERGLQCGTPRHVDHPLSKTCVT